MEKSIQASKVIKGKSGKDDTVIRLVPKSFGKAGELLAKEKCMQDGIVENSPDYEESMEENLFNFFDQGYGLSMTPSGLIGTTEIKGQNPATPKVKHEFFKELDGLFGETGLLKKVSGNREAFEKYDKVLRSNITSIAHFILASNYDLNLKRTELPSAFEYNDTMTTEEREIVIQNQYMRLYFIAVIGKAVEEILDSHSQEDISLGDLFSEVFGNEWEENKNRVFTFLNDTEKRKAFVRHFYKKGNKPVDVKAQNPYRGESSLSKKNISQSIIDNFLKNVPESRIVQIKSNAEFCYGNEVDERKIERASFETPVLFGTKLINGKQDHFVISGHEKIMKALRLGLPSIDAVVLTVKETKDFVN